MDDEKKPTPKPKSDQWIAVLDWVEWEAHQNKDNHTARMASEIRDWIRENHAVVDGDAKQLTLSDAVAARGA